MTIFASMGPQQRPLLPALRADLVAKIDERSGRRTPGRPSPTPRRRLTQIAAAVLAVASLIAGITVGSSREDEPSRSVGRSAPGSSGHRPGSTARMQFAVFGEEQAVGSSDGSVGGLFGARDTGDPDLRIRLADARRLAIASAEVWAAPVVERDRPAICIRARSLVAGGVVTGTCAPLATASTSGLWVTTTAAPRGSSADAVDAVGLVPDGVEAVTFTTHDGRPVEARVSDNAVAAAFDRRPRSVEFQSREGSTQRTTF